MNQKKNKRAWIRILEATIAVLLVSSVLVVVYTRQPEKNLDSGEFVYTLQKEIANEISLNETLRNEVLSSNQEQVSAILSSFVSSKIPSPFGHRIRICELQTPPNPCKLNATDFMQSRNADIFVYESIISSNLTAYSPKKIKLYVWEHRT